jgi:type IV pilus assembly protein PilO
MLVLIACVILLLGYWFDLSLITGKTQNLKREEATLKITLATKQQVAVNLPAYEKQLAQAKQQLQTITKLLPNKQQLPNLIENISKLGQNNSLRFLLLKPEPEILHDFYAEFPIDIVVNGNFKNLHQFVSQLAVMPRIVNIGDFKLKQTDSATPSPTLQLEFTAKTYRFLSEAEIKKQKEAKDAQPSSGH